jgi:hypothetical protein
MNRVNLSVFHTGDRNVVVHQAGLFTDEELLRFIPFHSRDFISWVTADRDTVIKRCSGSHYANRGRLGITCEV